MIARARHGMNLEVQSRALARVTRTSGGAPGAVHCLTCLGGANATDPLLRECAFRVSSGWAHTTCLVKSAEAARAPPLPELIFATWAPWTIGPEHQYAAPRHEPGCLIFAHRRVRGGGGASANDARHFYLQAWSDRAARAHLPQGASLHTLLDLGEYVEAGALGRDMFRKWRHILVRDHHQTSATSANLAVLLL